MDAISDSRALKRPSNDAQNLAASAPYSRRARCSGKKIWFLRSIIRINREPLFIPGGSTVQILVPWKPVVLVWGLLSGMILVGFIASSLLQGRDPFAPGATIAQHADVKAAAVQAGQQPKHKAARTTSQ